MKNLKICILLMLALTIAACSSVKSTSMLGDYALKLHEDEWNGTWVIDNDSYQIRVVNPDFGIMESTSIKDGKSIKHRLFATQSEENRYINLVGANKTFYFVKFKKEKDSITVWEPSTKFLNQAITNNEIEGKIDSNNDLLITANSNALKAFFKKNQNLMIFDIENPSIFKRSSK